MDARAYLACEDPDELAVMDAVLVAADEIRREHLDYQAEVLARAVWGDAST